ncbi:hypothetical protein ACFYUY_26605 [Kitasatospora sp. NPDC004745]|uniref:hypothetical protein n=1 Tax=Kitasatospora sp. NPDC004745 TaxID=3364019 RepID=UPI0036C75C5B
MTAGQRGPAPPWAAALPVLAALGWAVSGSAPAERAAPAPVAGSALITLVDNSHADSWVEIDRTADVQQGSGSAGSDQDGPGSLVGGLLGIVPNGGVPGGGR